MSFLDPDLDDDRAAAVFAGVCIIILVICFFYAWSCPHGC